jgi:hypothetical protein
MISHVTASWTMAAERKKTTPRQSAAGRQRNLAKEAGWSVELEIDKTVRVSEAELLVLEIYLGRQLDALFGVPAHPATALSCPKGR